MRGNVDGELELLTYGRSSGFCIDPIEKKPLYHWLPGTPVLSLGTAGCNLGCTFCQNWDISTSRSHDTLAATATPAAIARAAAQSGCRSVAFTYNDPVIWAEYAIDIAREARALGLGAVAVTAGYIAAPARAEFFGAMDAANIDLKAFSEHFYRRQTLSSLEPVLETLRYVARETDVLLEITTLLIPGHNDGDDELRRMSDWVVRELGPEVPMHFSAFHPDHKLRDVERTPGQTLRRARRIALEAGAAHVYVGNVRDPEGEATRCAGCGTVLIERDRYQLGAYRLVDGACPDCGRRLHGRFEARPGSWGPRRQRLAIA